MSDEFELVKRTPTPEEYQALRRAVGWRDVPARVVARAMPQALYSVCVLRAGQVVGHGRVVGDGGLCFYLEDVALLPELQGMGLGRRLMDDLMVWLDANVPPGRTVYLMAAAGSAGFYEQYGFERRPDDAPGMSRRWPQRPTPGP